MDALWRGNGGRAGSSLPARPLGRNLEERPRLFGTNLHEIGIAMVAVAITMVIWFYASSLGFTPNWNGTLAV
jgi:hypothetical protein